MDKITLSNEILNACAKSLCSEFIYFAYPIGRLNPKSKEHLKTVCTNGEGGYFSPEKVCELTALGRMDEVKGEILHLLMHCIFLHPFKKAKNAQNYGLACDITVGYILDGLQYPFGDKLYKIKRKAVYKSIIDRFGGINDNFTQKFAENLTREEADEMKRIFTVCDHSPWYPSSANDETASATVNLNLGDGGEEIESLAEGWSAIARNLLPQIGKLNPDLKRVITVAVGGDGEYKSFLRSFIRKRERIKASEDEFDYIFYKLGLDLYKNVPLIENLEYSDARNYAEIVIAIDTSGSTDGEPIKKLLKEVFGLIKSMETTSERYKLRIIQCDLKVQKEDVVVGSEEFSELMENYRLYGGGGTDFRPVFNRLTDLKRKGEKIEGLIYFTDGMGVYPKEVPPFKTCFVILGDGEGVEVPHFAYKINVEEDLL